jgi:uncharacterized protein
LSGKVADLGGKYEFVLVQPKLAFSSPRSGGAAAKLEFVPGGAAHVRTAGPMAPTGTQFAAVAQGSVAGLICSVPPITVWLSCIHPVASL